MIICDTPHEADILVRLVGVALSVGGSPNAGNAVRVLSALAVKPPQPKVEEIPAIAKDKEEPKP